MIQLFKIIILLLLSSNFLFAQQKPLYTNYHFNPEIYNPALTGVKKTFSIKTIGRKQWVGLTGSPFTQNLSLSAPLKNVPLGFGLAGYFDRTGPLQNTFLNFQMAYHQSISDDVILSLGVNGGFGHLTLTDEYTIREMGDLSVQAAVDGKFTADFGLGVNLNLWGVNLGFAVPQIIEPAIKLSADDPNDLNNYVRHFFASIDKTFKIGENFYLRPSALLKRVNGAPYQGDFTLMVSYKDIIWIGTGYRTKDAIPLLFKTNISNVFEIGYSYDFSVNTAKAYNNGSHEFYLGYNLNYKKDSDGDGIIDEEDKCPYVVGIIINLGCPDEDIDGDGINNDIDDCPTKPGPLENNGCPVVDTDGDGIYDHEDECPEEKGLLSNNGCPVADTDGDGVPDEEDDCPNTIGIVINFGCPVVTVEQNEVVQQALENLEFETGKDIIKDYSKPYLDNLAEVMLENPDWKIKLTGHTDNVGDEENNLILSRDRANAVKFYILGKGVDARRIYTDYYGETRPIDTNETEIGRQRNRRVEMEFVFE